MSFWFCAQGTGVQAREGDSAVTFPSGGLPDLSKALSRDHLREWIKHLHAEALPEFIDDETSRYWELFTSLHRDDHVIAVRDPATLALGEITGDYRFENGEHVWPVRWLNSDIPLASFPTLQHYKNYKTLKEIQESEARILLRKYFPSLRAKSYVLFRWVSIIILVAELVYFWPHAK